MIARLLRGAWHHYRNGSITDALRRRAGLPSLRNKVRWEGTRKVDEAARALIQQVELRKRRGETGAVALAGDESALRAALIAGLDRRGIAWVEIDPARPGDARQLPGGNILMVIATDHDARRLTGVARALAAQPALSEIPFEYVPGLSSEQTVFERLDEYRGTFFVSPVLLDEPSPYAIYEQSLTLFEQKCGLRDFLDLYQIIKGLVQRGVAGDIAEFGSYRGHSGWLIAQTLCALGSDKQVYLFDTFADFPQERFGLDHFWSKTHQVDFESVRAKFSTLSNVHFVQGDFTETLVQSGLSSLALAYIDCDSYRATRYLFGALWSEVIERGGLIVCEDYGHPALLGNRAAVHDSLDAVPEAITFYSQFSGLHLSIKP